MGYTVDLPEESHYYTSATKQPAYNMPNNTWTSLKAYGTKLIGLMRLRWNLIITTINVVCTWNLVKNQNDGMMKSTCQNTGGQFELISMEAAHWTHLDIRT